MAGVLFIVNIPRREHEADLRKKEKTAKVAVEQEKYEKASKMIHELKEHKRFSTLKTSSECYGRHDDTNIVISKCKSTDCLHSNDKEIGLHKSKSDNVINVLNDNESLRSETKSYPKSSWEEIKQVMKPKRNKFKISRPGRAVDILNAFHWDTPLEIILSEIITALDIQNAAWNATKDNRFWQVTFSLESSNLCEELLQVLRTLGIGSRHRSSVCVIPCSLYYQSSYNEDALLEEKEGLGIQNDTTTAWSRFSSSVRDRTNLAQVLHLVRSNATLTFDWLFLLLVAAFIAAIGLTENSTVILVASMLISPLMAPITAGTLGTIVRDRSLQYMGVLHEMLGLFLCVVIGFIFGLTVCVIGERYADGDWPTEAMMSRCAIRSLWVGVLVAVPSGAGVALAVLGEHTASLVGVAISASLLPPAVNAGLLWSLALVQLIYANENTRWTPLTTPYYSNDRATELAVLGAVSLCLTLINILCIFLVGIAVYKVKEVYPLDRKDISWWRANRNIYQTSNNDKFNVDNSSSWYNYSNWCNEPEPSTEKKDTTLGLVQSDTVTFRRPSRLRAQNIEAYCLQRERLGESFMPLEVHTTKYEVHVDKDKGNSEPQNVDVNNKDDDYSQKFNSSLDFDTKYSFYNLAFHDLENDNKKFEDNVDSDRPTMEPSQSCTVDSKQYGLVLDTKSFHV